jgi:hypothetical protein
MNTKTYASILRGDIQHNRYATLTKSIGTQLNGRSDRFDKANFIENGVALYSSDRFKRIDGIGRDFLDIKLNLDVEFKYVNNGLFTAKGKQKTIVKVKLKNSLGKYKGTVIDDPADYYMIAQQDSIAIISWEEINPYLVGVPDGIEAHIPFGKLEFIFRPNNITVGTAVKFSYKEEKDALQRKLIESI